MLEILRFILIASSRISYSIWMTYSVYEPTSRIFGKNLIFKSKCGWNDRKVDKWDDSQHQRISNSNRNQRKPRKKSFDVVSSDFFCVMFEKNGRIINWLFVQTSQWHFGRLILCSLFLPLIVCWLSSILLVLLYFAGQNMTGTSLHLPVSAWHEYLFTV